MRALMIAMVAVLLLGSALLPYPVRGEHGAYNPWSRLAWCDTRYACLHEIGHALDQQAGWASQSPDFADALRLYVVMGAQAQEPLAVYILAMLTTAPDGQEPTKKELYAYLYAYSDGRPENLPEALRRFFGWGRGERHKTQLDGRRLLWLIPN